MVRTMICVLDFDGVLHPEALDAPIPAEKEFCQLGALEALLREFPQVLVVISSSWRESVEMSVLVGLFSEDIQPRIIGATPTAGPDPYGRGHISREDEVRAWLIANGGLHQIWVALDDLEHQFVRHRDRLVACDRGTGLDERSFAELRQHFERGAAF